MTKWVYSFGAGKAEGRADMRGLLGGKGAGLAEMSNLGLPVPPGFTITTEVCTYFYKHNRAYPPELKSAVEAALKSVGEMAGGHFGDPAKPLLVSVRSGARASMPGMMDTVLNLGLNPATVEGLVKLTGDERFAYDAYRRFIQMYSRYRARAAARAVRGNPRHGKRRQGRRARHRSRCRRSEAHRRPIQGARGEGARQAVPRRCERAALGRHRRGVRILGRRAREDLSPAQQHSR